MGKDHKEQSGIYLMSSNKRSLLKIILTASGGCGCSKTKPSDVYEPTTKPKLQISIYPQNNPNRTSSLTFSTTSAEPNANGSGFSVDNDEDFTCSTVSEPETDDKSSKFVIQKLNGSVAVEKDSEDPYKDIRHSMLQIIFEKEIHSQSDLQSKTFLNAFFSSIAPLITKSLLEPSLRSVSKHSPICEHIEFTSVKKPHGNVKVWFLIEFADQGHQCITWGSTLLNLKTREKWLLNGFH